MKNNLFEILLKLCEKSISQLQKIQIEINKSPLEVLQEPEESTVKAQCLHLKGSKPSSTRVLSYLEQIKLSKSAYQFLVRMKSWGIIDDGFFEQLMNSLLFSESPLVTQEEAKWTMRKLLSKELNEEALAFLDLVLYQKEDNYTTH